MGDHRADRAHGVGREALRDSLAIALVAVIPLALLHPLQDAPFVDDWTYAWSVDKLLRGGGLELLEWSAHPNVVQILWGALFCLPGGFSFTALRASTWVLATSGMVALYLLFRQLGVPLRDALIGTLTIGVNPIFFVLSFTFMTDVPFVALATWSILAMVYALTRRSDAWLAVAVLAACLATGVRPVGAVLPVAMALTLLLGSPSGGLGAWGRRPWRVALTLLPLLFLAALAWWTTAHVRVTVDIAGVANSPPQRVLNLSYAVPRLPLSLIQALGSSVGVLGLGLLPVVLGSVHRKLLLGAVVCAATLAVLLVIGALGGAPYDPPLVKGSIWATRELGAAESLVPGAPPADNRLATWVLTPAALLSWGVVAFALMRRRPRAPTEAFLAWLVLGQLLLVALLWLFYDRYLLPLLVPALGLVLCRERVRRPRVAALVLAAFALLSTLGLRDHLVYSSALWQAVGELRAMGARDGEINAGYVVSGWLLYTRPDEAPRGPDGKPRVPWINGSKDEPLRYWVANSAVPEYDVVRTIAYRRWLAPSGRMFILERRMAAGSGSPGSPAPDPATTP